MNDSELSFFNYSEINFADELSEAAENKVYLHLCGNEIYEDGVLAGTIFLSVRDNIKRGKLILFFETYEEVRVSVIKKNYTFKSELDRIRCEQVRLEKIRALSGSEENYWKHASNLQRNKFRHYIAYSNLTGKINHFLASIYSPNITTNSKSTTKEYSGFDDQELEMRSTRIFLKELEIFSITSDINKKVSLLLPFMIRMKSKMELSIDYSFGMNFILKEGTRSSTHTIGNIPSKTQTPMLSDNGNRQYFKVKHNLKVAFVPYNSSKNFPKLLTPEEKLNEILTLKDSCLIDSCEFRILDSMKKYSLSKYFSTLDLDHEEVIPRYCLRPKVNQIQIPVSISLDCVLYTNFDSNINFILQFSKILLEKYRFLDVVLKKRIDTKREEVPYSIEHMMYFETHDLLAKFPRNCPKEDLEFVHHLKLKKIGKIPQTIKTNRLSLRYYIIFYLSKKSYSFEYEAFSKELTFLKLKKDTNIYGNEVKNRLNKHIQVIIEKLNKEDNIIMLPFSKVQLN